MSVRRRPPPGRPRAAVARRPEARPAPPVSPTAVIAPVPPSVPEADADSDLLLLNADLLELDSDVLQLETDGPVRARVDPAGEDLPAGVTYALQQHWSRVRPHWLRAREAARVGAVRLWRRGRPVAVQVGSWIQARWARRRLALPGWARRLSVPGWARRLTVPSWARRWWPGWPTSWPRLGLMAAAAFALGMVVALPVALSGRSPARPVSVERAAAPAPRRTRPPARPRPVEANRADADDRGESPPATPAAGTSTVPTRALVARQMAREAFEAGHATDGVWYYRMGVRAQRRVPDDDTLTMHTINALSDQRAAAAAERLLRDLGRDARPLVAETARSHPERAVRQRARQIAAGPQPRPFLRWLR